MFSSLRRWLLKKLYRRFVLGVVILGEHCRDYYKRVEPFCVIEVESSHGPILFRFKEDRRNRHNLGYLAKRLVTNYIIEMIPPEKLINVVGDLNKDTLLVVKFLLFNVDYEVLVEVLSDIYLDTHLHN